MSNETPIPGDDEKTHLLTELEEAETLLLMANEHITTLEQQLKDCREGIQKEITRLEQNPQGDYVTRISALEWALELLKGGKE